MRRFIAKFLGVFVLPVLLLAAPAGATAPSRNAVFIDMDGTAEIARKHFRETNVAAMRIILAQHINPKPLLQNPYGGKFVGLGESGASGFHILARAFSVVWGVSCKGGNCDAFKTFLAELEKRTRVRAMISSSRYSGCAEAKYDFVGAEEQSAPLSIRLFSRQFSNCRPAKRKLISGYTLWLQ